MERFQTTSPGEMLYANRTLFLFGEVDQSSEMTLVPMLLALNALGSEPITLYIDSPGGSVSAGLAIYDTMQFIKAPVYTICIGTAASMAAWLLASGAPGHRVATENSSIMIHQGHSMVGGKISDMQITMQHYTATAKKMNMLLARHTGRTARQVAQAVQNDRWMTPQQAREFGIVDEVVIPDVMECVNRK